MAGEAVVFVGPSVLSDDLASARDYLDIRPPIKRGDLTRLLDDDPSMIGIVDGEFFQAVAVSPKEIWRALRRGIPVFGAASIGALRAVELGPLGMRGIGVIFEWFKSGRLDRDDDVGFIYTLRPDGRYVVETLPMVNVLWATRIGVERNLLRSDEAEALNRRARRLDWRTRTWSALFRDVSAPPEFRRLAEDPECDRKRLDAALLMATMIRTLGTAVPERTQAAASGA